MGNKIIKAKYSYEIDDLDYSELLCTLDNGEEKIFHFHSKNPMPKEDLIINLTWEELRGVCIGMWRMAVDDYIQIGKLKKLKGLDNDE